MRVAPARRALGFPREPSDHAHIRLLVPPFASFPPFDRPHSRDPSRTDRRLRVRGPVRPGRVGIGRTCLPVQPVRRAARTRSAGPSGA
ncbi:hypothetical protein NJ7G_3628 [Natrinema sp. J7-2]|nr:hypothetical protein NJ7G_3628 [Natrinema sp. J7-2]